MKLNQDIAQKAYWIDTYLLKSYLPTGRRASFTPSQVPGLPTLSPDPAHQVGLMINIHFDLLDATRPGSWLAIASTSRFYYILNNVVSVNLKIMFIIIYQYHIYIHFLYFNDHNGSS